VPVQATLKNQELMIASLLAKTNDTLLAQKYAIFVAASENEMYPQC